MKIRPVGAELFHAGGRTDGRTDKTKLTVVFRNFANAPRNRPRLPPKHSRTVRRVSTIKLLAGLLQMCSTHHVASQSGLQGVKRRKTVANIQVMASHGSKISIVYF